MVTSGLREGFLGYLVDELSCRESAGFPLVVCSGGHSRKQQEGLEWVWGSGGEPVSLGSEPFKAEALFLIWVLPDWHTYQSLRNGLLSE